MAPLDAGRARVRLAHAAVLDCRSEDEFARGHLPASGNVPLESLAMRRTELPPRDAPVLVVAGSGARAAAAAAALAALGYTRLDWLDAPFDVLLDGPADRTPAAPLWRPAPYLAARIDGIPRGAALDLACGAGRESVFLAMHGFEVTAVDRAAEALGWAQSLARRHGVSMTTLEMDLEGSRVNLPRDRFGLVCVFRFLHRPLLPMIEAALAPGGHLIYETFRSGQERHGRPSHPRFLLRSGELSRAFANLEVLHEEETSPPGGPVTARLHARRRA